MDLAVHKYLVHSASCFARVFVSTSRRNSGGAKSGTVADWASTGMIRNRCSGGGWSDLMAPNETATPLPGNIGPIAHCAGDFPNHIARRKSLPP